MKEILLTLMAILLFSGVAIGSELTTLVAEHDVSQVDLTLILDSLNTTMDSIATLQAEVGIIDDSLAFVQRGRVCPSATVDGSVPASSFITRCTTPDGSSTAWTTASHALFSVTGVVNMRIFGYVVEAISENGGNTDIAIGQDGTDIKTFTTDAQVDFDLAEGSIGEGTDWFVAGAADIDVIVSGFATDDGSMVFYAEWYPLETSAAVDSTDWD